MLLKSLEITECRLEMLADHLHNAEPFDHDSAQAMLEAAIGDVRSCRNLARATGWLAKDGGPQIFDPSIVFTDAP